jgi:hypothetical protein
LGNNIINNELIALAIQKKLEKSLHYNEKRKKEVTGRESVTSVGFRNYGTYRQNSMAANLAAAALNAANLPGLAV